eukprot:gnl/TRDRNA2_/TRDRNA2_32114_c0_seq1.p1 gnl/TRDRNA2_/TRDRNA2_32114_c0~~gnl/TRDRNA2_/TRDRNA2_32114_c0_seq1.p1  ORF type:complete len:137 (-),score=9.87 gnl/TRDRNA2_/TRDRNA2_32114_c0_seq1:495-878(-)
MAAVLAAVQAYMGWELLFFTMLIVPIAGKIYWDTSRPLYRSAGIVDYWKNGEQAADDPFDLAVPIEAFQSQVGSFRQGRPPQASVDIEEGFTGFASDALKGTLRPSGLPLSPRSTEARSMQRSWLPA